MSEVSWRQLVTLSVGAQGPTQKVSLEHLDQVRERALGTSVGRAFQAEMQMTFGIMKSLALKTARDQWWEWSKPGREQYKAKDIRGQPFHQAQSQMFSFFPLSFSFFLWTERAGPLEEFPPRNDLIKCMIRKEGTRLREAIATMQMTLVQIQHGVEVAAEVVKGGILCLFEKSGGARVY